MEVVGARVGKKTSCTTASGIPDCVVCGQKSTGFHYGAYTCEACKGFFRRVLKKESVNFTCICMYSQRCESGEKIWANNCANCRYKRCVYVGMGRDAIKPGRSSSPKKCSKKTEDRKPYQTNKKSKTKCDDLLLIDCSNHNSITSSFANDPGRVDGAVCPNEPCQDDQKTHRNGKDVFDLGGISTSVQTVASQSSPGDALRRLEFEWSENEMDSIIATLVRAQRKTVEDDYIHIVDKEELERGQREYYEQYKLKTEIFGPMDLSKQQCHEIYSATGLDMGDHMQFFNEFCDNMEKKIVQIVEFVKKIPGFTDIHINDQANLIKAGRAEFCFLGCHHVYNSDLKVMTLYWGRHMHQDEWKDLCKSGIMELKFQLAKRLGLLELSLEERALLSAIIMVSKDRADLSCPEQVDAIQWKLVTCLRYWVQKHKDTDKNRLAHLLSILSDLREYAEKDEQLIKALTVEMPLYANHRLIQALI